MDSIAPTASQPRPAPLGAALAALLGQVPASLATQIRDAWADDLSRIYRVGLDHGSGSALKAIQEFAPAGQPVCRPWCASHITTVGDGDLCRGETVTLDFSAPDRPASYVEGVQFGLGYAADEGDSVFVAFTGVDEAYMTVQDARRMAESVLKMTGGAR